MINADTIKTTFHRVLQIIAFKVAGGCVKGKKLFGTNKILYYEIPQHLGFLFHQQIVYEKELQKKLSDYITDDSLVFDVGSNIGQYALWFSSLVKDGKVVCYEPDKKNYAFLSFNILINEIPNINVNNIGISDTVSNAKFYRDTLTGGRTGSLGQDFVGKSFQGQVQKVELSTLDAEIEKHGIPDFVKIDVEGFEYSVIKGLKKPNRSTVFFIEVRDSSSQQVFNYFKEYDFNCTLLDISPSKTITNPDDIPAFCNLLFKH